MRNVRALALIGLVVLSAASVAVGPAAGAPGVVTISTETTPDQPAPGENVTITTTITNPEGGSESYSVRNVELRATEADDSELYDEDGTDSSIGVGETVTRELAAEVETSGEQTYVLHIQLLSNGQVRNLERTVTVTAGQPDPALSLSAEPLGPSGDTTLRLNVSNPRPDTIRSLTVDLAGDSVSFDEDRRIVPQLASGSVATLRYPVSNVDTGTGSVTAQVEYTTADGEFVSTTETLTTTVDRVKNPGNVTLSAVEVRNVGGELRVSGQANNVGGTAVSSVSVAAADEADSLGPVQSRTFVGELGASDSREFSLAVATPESSTETTIPVDVEYLIDGERVSRTLSVTYEPGSNGDVSLSGVEIVTRSGETSIVGRANNVGDTNVSSLQISVADGAYSLGDAQSRTFVGSLAPSGSGAFDLAVGLPEDGQSATIPVEVRYRVDGQTVSRSIAVEHQPGSSGDIDLTGLRIEQTGDRLTIRGSTSNLGTANASAVVVSVGDGEAVAPAQSESSYFVGSIDESDFKSFQVDAQLTADTNETISIPVEVRYRVDGQRVTQTIPVSYTPTTQAPAGQPQRGSGTPVALLGGGLLAALVGGFAYRRYR